MGLIDIKNLSFSYDNQTMAVNDVSFSIAKGSYTTIVGHNGSGKSTIAKLILGLLEKKSGEIIIDGLDLNSTNIQDIRNKIGIVFQNPDNQFIGATVRDDIAFGLENHCVPQQDMDDIINQFSSKVKMTDYLNSEPGKLSGGQKQRVAIAGVLAMSPQILIFDEATSMLDPLGKDEIKKVIRELHTDKEITIISITHDIEEVAKSDDVIVMDKGKVFMCGKPSDILRREKELVSIKLDIPFSLKLQKALKKNGVNVHEHITIEGLVEELCQYASIK